jgi:hypothetical protein
MDVDAFLHVVGQVKVGVVELGRRCLRLGLLGGLRESPDQKQRDRY